MATASKKSAKMKKTACQGLSKRGNVYYAGFRKNGKLIRKRLSSDFGVAKQALNVLEGRADKGDFGIMDNDYRWEELKTEFLQTIRADDRDSRDRERHLRRFEEYRRVVSIREVTPDYVKGFREWRLCQDY